MAPSHVSRRDLLSAGAVLGSACALQTPAAAKSISGDMPWSPGVANAPEPAAPAGYQFFSADEAAFIEAAVSRLIPNDDLGPGAKEAGVGIFIDRQLSGAYGSAESWYMRGPWARGHQSQGYQTRLTPAQLYRAAIKAIDDHCRETFAGKTLRRAQPASSRTRCSSGLEKGDIKLGGVERSNILRDLPAEHHRRLLRRSDLWRQPRHGRLEADRLSRRALRLSRLCRQARRAARRSPPVGLKGRPGWTPHELRSRAMAKKLPSVDVVLVGFGWTGAILARN